MGNDEFRALVRQMRNAQRRWFKSKGRDHEALELSKNLERQVDRELRMDEQPTLFGKGD